MIGGVVAEQELRCHESERLWRVPVVDTGAAWLDETGRPVRSDDEVGGRDVSMERAERRAPLFHAVQRPEPRQHIEQHAELQRELQG